MYIYIHLIVNACASMYVIEIVMFFFSSLTFRFELTTHIFYFARITLCGWDDQRMKRLNCVWDCGKVWPLMKQMELRFFFLSKKLDNTKTIFATGLTLTSRDWMALKHTKKERKEYGRDSMSRSLWWDIFKSYFSNASAYIHTFRVNQFERWRKIGYEAKKQRARKGKCGKSFPIISNELNSQHL